MLNQIEEARVDAVKSATEIINAISRQLTLKDLDLFLIDTLMTPRTLSFYSITDDWADRDYRQVGVIYGGSLAILSLLLLAIGALLYLPVILMSFVAGRYFYLRYKFTKVAQSRSFHLHTLKIARYLVLHAQASKKKSLFSDMSVKYTMLKYIRDKNSIAGADYLKMFAHIDNEVDFYKLLHGVIDDVLLYAVAQEASLYANHKDINERNDKSYDDAEEHEILKKPPEKSHRDAASNSKHNFAKALASPSAGNAINEASSQGKVTSEREEISDDLTKEHESTEDTEEMSSRIPEENAINEDDSIIEQAHSVNGETSHEEENQDDSDEDLDYDFSLDDMDEDFEIELPLSDEEGDDSGDDGEEEEFDDIDDDVLEEIGLAEGDLK